MSQPRTIALDAMGGDHGPSVVVPGAALSLERSPALSFIFYGDEQAIRAELERLPALAARSRVVHTDRVIGMSEKPSQALRRGKGSSLWMTIDAVRNGEADVAVSAGNTGAFMAMSKLILRPIKGIERPALAAIWPTVKAECIVLDVGANIGASSRELCHLAMMGAAMARALFHIERPTVGLLNVGVEEVKGVDEVREAHSILKSTAELPLDYRGFIEGDQIGQGSVDVVVVEGFAGNIALKTAEGTAKQIAEYLRAAMRRTWLSKLGAVLASGGFRVLKEKMDPRRVNGGTFLGLNGIAVKSHGGTDALGFASAVDLAYEMAQSHLIPRLTADLTAFHDKLEATTDTTAG
ncbi:Phosphate:acyl-ACP acyltransferase PlsX [Hyphomicrobium sulfonivorans]|uniref:Phosphate acyltransferase n=1 Tax=Hyphomicrobium sulfonivorans TaxID=121290 RepID=A0A120CXV6_HYPSL|nr:phosphate acyltransferase PlsX [Hyphomicrobium sulfonivorans]KWT71579.1 Phosphate:acyl-ACP acyltransferase PlsX [Hyphomicrobium sulfonivorans]